MSRHPIVDTHDNLALLMIGSFKTIVLADDEINGLEFAQKIKYLIVVAGTKTY